MTPGGRLTASYSATLQATGGSGSKSWSVVSGALPGGLTLDGSTGAISGTPTSAGTFGVTVKVTDKDGDSDEADIRIAKEMGWESELGEEEAAEQERRIDEMNRAVPGTDPVC